MSEANFREVFFNLPIPTLLLNPHKEILAASQSFLEMHNLKDSETLGKKCYEIFRHDKQECSAEVCNFQGAMEGQLGLYNTQEYINAKGDQIIEEIHLGPCFDENGRVWGIIESVRDITEAKHLESSLRQTNEFVPLSAQFHAGYGGGRGYERQHPVRQPKLQPDSGISTRGIAWQDAVGA